MVSAESVRSVWRTTFDPKDKLTDATAEFGITGSDIYLADQHTMTFERTLIALFANFSDELAGEPGMDFDLLYSTPRRWVGFLVSSVFMPFMCLAPFQLQRQRGPGGGRGLRQAGYRLHPHVHLHHVRRQPPR